MDKILEKFDELEKEIKDTNEFQRCPDYYEGCIQCDFWKNFDELKSFFKKQFKQKSTLQEKTKDALSEDKVSFIKKSDLIDVAKKVKKNEDTKAESDGVKDDK